MHLKWALWYSIFYLVLSVTQHSVHGPMGSLLNGFLNLTVGCRLGQTACQVDHGHISHWHSECHACQLSAEMAQIHDEIWSAAVLLSGDYADKTRMCGLAYPLRSGMTLPTALAAPVEAGMMFWWAPRPSRQAFPLGPSTVFWVAVYAWTVVYTHRVLMDTKSRFTLTEDYYWCDSELTIRASSMPKLSWMTLARGARQLVVQEALLQKRPFDITLTTNLTWSYY